MVCGRPSGAEGKRGNDVFRTHVCMNIWQIGFVVRSGVSALVVAFLLGYAAHYQWGFSRVAIRTDALLPALLIGTLVAIEFFGRNLGKPKKYRSRKAARQRPRPR